MRPVSNTTRRHAGAFASEAAIASGVDAVFASCTTVPSRSTTQTCVSSIEISRPVKWPIGRSPLLMTEPILSPREELPSMIQCR